MFVEQESFRSKCSTEEARSYQRCHEEPYKAIFSRKYHEDEVEIISQSSRSITHLVAFK